VDHEAEDAHHRCAAPVELDGPLLQLPLLGLLRSAEVEPVAEVPPEFRLAGDIGDDADLVEGEQRQDLEEAGGGDGVQAIDGGEAVGEASEGVALEVDVAGEVSAHAGNEVPNEHAWSCALLELDLTEAVGCLLVGAVEEAERILEAEGGLGAETDSKALSAEVVLAAGAGVKRRRRRWRWSSARKFRFPSRSHKGSTYAPPPGAHLRDFWQEKNIFFLLPTEPSNAP
jgi:hypothetical protein